MTNLRKTLTVIGPHGSEVTVLKPGLGQVIVIAQAGVTVRGMRFGALYMVDGLNRSHQTLDGARQIARGEA